MAITLDGTTGVTAAEFDGTVDASNLTGVLPAIDGSALTGIDTSPPTTAGVVGTYGFFKNTADVNTNFGSTLSGSSLVPSNAIGLNYSSPTVSGTWMAVGDSYKYYKEALTTLWLRIS